MEPEHTAGKWRHGGIVAQVRVREHFTPGVYLEIRERVMEPVCAGAVRYASSGNTKQPLHGTDSGADGLASSGSYILCTVRR